MNFSFDLPQEALHDLLPAHVLTRILECVETKERARLALVCKDWKELVSQSWSSIQLSFTTLAQLQEQRKWLDLVAAQGSGAVQAIEILWKGGALFSGIPILLSLPLACEDGLHVKHTFHACGALNSIIILTSCS